MTRPGRKVVVTGAGGFIGRHLVRDQLSRGNSVAATDVNLSGLEAMGLDGDLICEQVDIRSTDAMRNHLHGCDTVFHLAAAHLDVLKDEEYFHDVNVRATGEFAGMAAGEGVRRFVHCSTAGVYGPLETLPANEATPTAPDIQYERSKLAGEKAVCDATTNAKTIAVIIRPAWVYGPQCRRTQKLIRTIARRRFFYVGDGINLRHPIYISDMLDAFELAATRDLRSGEIIIVAGPESISVRQLVDLIIEELGIDSAPLRLPTWFVTALCFGFEKLFCLVGREPPFSRRSLKFYSDSSSFDIAKAGQLLGFHPAVTVRDGLRQTIEYCRRQGALPADTGAERSQGRL